MKRSIYTTIFMALTSYSLLVSAYGRLYDRRDTSLHNHNPHHNHNHRHHHHHHHHHGDIHNLHDFEVEHMENEHDMHEGDYDDESFFRQHDLNDDGYLDREEMLIMYHGHEGPESEEDRIEGEDLIRSIYAEVDGNHDQLISLHEFLHGLNSPLDNSHHHHAPPDHSFDKLQAETTKTTTTTTGDKRQPLVQTPPDVYAYVPDQSSSSSTAESEPNVYHLHPENYGQGVKAGAKLLHHPDMLTLHGHGYVHDKQDIFQVPDQFKVNAHSEF